MDRGRHDLDSVDVFIKKGTGTVRLSLTATASDADKLKALGQKAGDDSREVAQFIAVGPWTLGCTPLTAWLHRPALGVRQQAVALAYHRPQLQQRQQNRGQDRPQKDAHNAEHLDTAEDGY